MVRGEGHRGIFTALADAKGALQRLLISAGFVGAWACSSLARNNSGLSLSINTKCTKTGLS